MENIKTFRIYSETFVEAESEEEAYDIGVSRLNNAEDDYDIEQITD